VLPIRQATRARFGHSVALAIVTVSFGVPALVFASGGL